MAVDTNLIFANDYNTIRSKILRVLGTGSADFGYGQNLVSSDIPMTEPKPIITKEQWDALRLDILNARIHQTGDIVSLKTVSTTEPIKKGAGEPNFQYDNVAITAQEQRFSIGTSRFGLTDAGSTSFTSNWSVSLSTEVTVTFATVDQARFFFNSGGKVRINSARSGGSATSQNTSWTTLLDSVGNVDFGGNTPTAVNFYKLTNSYQTYYNNSPTGTYRNNIFRLEAKCNVSNNSSGTANIVTIKVNWIDGYRDTGPAGFPPPDRVEGTLSLNIVELKASGGLIQADGSELPFTVESPTFSISAITGS